MKFADNYHRDHAAFRARQSPSGIGAAVVEFDVDPASGEHRWFCVVSDESAYRSGQVRSDQLGPWQRLPPPVVEEAVERFAATLPAQNRLYQLVNTNPIHLGRDGVARD